MREKCRRKNLKAKKGLSSANGALAIKKGFDVGYVLFMVDIVAFRDNVFVLLSFQFTFVRTIAMSFYYQPIDSVVVPETGAVGSFT